MIQKTSPEDRINIKRMICVSMDHLHIYVYEYSEKQNIRAQNFYNNTNRTDRIAASTKKHALK